MNKYVRSVFFLLCHHYIQAKLINISLVNSQILVECKYATADNFTGSKMYDCDEKKCYLQEEVAYALGEVQSELDHLGYGLKIWDGYRPLSVQWKLWNFAIEVLGFENPEGYVADPRKGGKHTTGAAVDLTLVFLDGTEVKMPTDFDDFSVKAHADYQDVPEDVKENRSLLRSVMENHGFMVNPYEWWHFNHVSMKDFKPLDVLFGDLE